MHEVSERTSLLTEKSGPELWRAWHLRATKCWKA